MTDPFDFRARCRSVVALHAHPDDETLATGPLLAELSAAGVAVHLVTATRGERGEIVPGSLDAGEAWPSAARLRDRQRALIAAREAEVACAAEVLGLTSQVFLGTLPARLPGLDDRAYGDSGMVWVAEGVAGPVPDADATSLTLSDLDEAVADLISLVQHDGADVLISYDEHGGYLHPDHVRCHEIAKRAAAGAGVPFVEIASEAFAPEGVAWRDYPDAAPLVLRALACYRTQLVASEAGITHVGGQHQDLPLRIGLRLTD